MNFKKAICSVLISMAVAFSATGCGDSGSASTASGGGQESPQAASQESGAAQETAAPGGEADWPDSIQLIVASTAGGFADVHARLVANYLQQETGVPVAVVNQAEGGGIVAYDTVKNAPKDGSSLLFYHGNFIIACETVYDADAVEDFTTIAALETGGSQVIVVSADSPYETLDDYINAALENPGQVSFGMQTGGASHFIGALLGKDKGAELDLVEAGNQTEKITSMLGGYIDACNISPAAALQYVEAGDMRILCTTSAEADPFYPDLPSPVELGYPSAVYESDFWLIGPDGMDPALVELLNGAFKNMETDEGMVESLATQGSHYTWRSPEESLEIMKEEVALHKELAANLGLA